MLKYGIPLSYKYVTGLIIFSQGVMEINIQDLEGRTKQSKTKTKVNVFYHMNRKRQNIVFSTGAEILWVTNNRRKYPLSIYSNLQLPSQLMVNCLKIWLLDLK